MLLKSSVKELSASMRSSYCLPVEEQISLEVCFGGYHRRTFAIIYLTLMLYVTRRLGWEYLPTAKYRIGEEDNPIINKKSGHFDVRERVL